MTHKSDDTQGDTELFQDSADSDTTADGESTSTEQASDSTAEEINEDLDLEVGQETNQSKADKERQKQVDVYAGRISRGEITIDQLPANMKWLKPHLEERLETVKRVPDMEQMIEKKIAEREDAKKFASLKETLNAQRLSPTRKKELETEFKDFLALGLTKSAALEKAAKVTGVDLYPEVSSEELRRSMRLPPIGRKLQVDKSDILNNPSDYKATPEADRLKKLEAARKGPR